MTIIEKHIVAYSIQGWGHMRPLVNLCVKLVRLRPMHVTLLTTNIFFNRAKAELARSIESADDIVASHIRLVSLGSVLDFGCKDDNKSFETAWKTIIAQDDLVCAHTGTHFTALPQPAALILDTSAIDPFLTVKALSGDSVKVFGWQPSLVHFLCHFIGPESVGGKGNSRILAEEEVERSGKTFSEVAYAMGFIPTGKIIEVPGMPPMYDHEYHPQDFPMPEEWYAHVYMRAFGNIQALDGLISDTPESYAPATIDAIRQRWFGKTGRPVYTCGPVLPPPSLATSTELEKKQATSGDTVQTFLDKTLVEFGEKSLLYIAFGSLMWPFKTPEKLWALLGVVMELGIPFMLAHPSRFAIIPEDVKMRVDAYGKGLLTLWAPQQLVLNHPATGWFVSHGGHNSDLEATSAVVPQIVWPYNTDQPLTAVHVSDVHRTGYELLEVRTGNGLKPILRTGYTPVGTVDAVRAEARDVLRRAFGEDGRERRVRLEGVRAAMLNEWKEGGGSLNSMTTFLNSL